MAVLDVYGVYRPLYHVTRLLALTPVPLDAIAAKATPSLSLYEVLYRVGVLTGLSAWFFATSVWSFRNFYPRFSSVVLAHMLEASCLVMTAISSVLLGTTVHRQKLTTFVRTLDKVLGGVTGGDNTRFLSRARSLAVVEVIAAGFAMASLYLVDSWHRSHSLFFPPFLMGYVMGFVNLVMHTQFTTSLLLVRGAFRALNASMLDDCRSSEDRFLLFRRNGLIVPRPARKVVGTKEKEVISRVGRKGFPARGTISLWVETNADRSDDEQRRRFVSRNSPWAHVDGRPLHFGRKRAYPVCAEDEEAATATAMSCGHADLRDCLTLLQKAFGVPVLLQLSAVTVGMVWCLYAVFVAVLRLPGSSLPSFAATSVYACRVVVHVSSLASLCASCSAACSQGNRTAFLLQRRLLDAAPHHDLRLLSQQLLHCRLQVMACGLFPINYRLVYVVLASVLTYLVLLLQFESRAPQRLGVSLCTTNFTEA